MLSWESVDLVCALVALAGLAVAMMVLAHAMTQQRCEEPEAAEAVEALARFARELAQRGPRA